MSRSRGILSALILFLAVLTAYSNHFENGFHFDDWHTIAENPYIRQLNNIPRFFSDGSMFSTLPTNQTYRPIVSTTLALDYQLSGGIDTQWFHIDSFAWFIALLGLTYFVYVGLMNRSRTDPRNSYIAFFAVALFGLHPVCAETVNYIIQRGEIQSTFGVAGGLAAYMYWPRARKWGLYILPAVIGILAKPPALMFAPILFAYIYLFESDEEGQRFARLKFSVKASLPAIIACLALALLHISKTPKSYSTGASSSYEYWITQPTVVLHYVKSFFLPTELTADSDRVATTGLLSETFVFSLTLIAFIAWTLRPVFRRPELKASAFGIIWFVLAVIPTSLQPLAELDNDHRMFFPFIGLTLTVCWWASQYILNFIRSDVIGVAAIVVLAACGYGTYQRNIVWHTEESLWKDVTEKSPHNGRGLMNYGLVLMEKGDYDGAIEYFQDAETYTPYYSTLMSNEGIAYGAINDDENAEHYFNQALSLAPENAAGYFFFARWLEGKKRLPEAADLLKKALALNSAHMDSRYLLMQIYSEGGNTEDLKALVEETLSLFPKDPTASGYLIRGL